MTGAAVQVTVRYYAGARAAAGVDSETVSGRTVTEVVSAVAALHGDPLRRVLDVATLLVEGRAVRDRGVALSDGATVEVLPPFAGG